MERVYECTSPISGGISMRQQYIGSREYETEWNCLYNCR